MPIKATKEYLYTPRPCPYCQRMMDKEMLLERGRKRGKSVSDALRTARSLGEPVGRPRSQSYEAIRKLRKEGLSLRLISQKIKCSIGVVQRALKTPESR